MLLPFHSFMLWSTLVVYLTLFAIGLMALRRATQGQHCSSRSLLILSTPLSVAEWILMRMLAIVVTATA
jgi:hypothetical protein